MELCVGSQGPLWGGGEIFKRMMSERSTQRLQKVFRKINGRVHVCA